MEKQYINFINKDLIIIEERGVKDPLEMFNDVPDKDFYSFQLECFKMLLEKKESGNHYNNRALLSAYRVIEYKEVRFDQFVYNGLADGRFSPDRHDLIMKYVSLSSASPDL
jgi:hypothetical protein